LTQPPNNPQINPSRGPTLSSAAQAFLLLRAWPNYLRVCHDKQKALQGDSYTGLYLLITPTPGYVISSHIRTHIQWGTTSQISPNIRINTRLIRKPLSTRIKGHKVGVENDKLTLSMLRTGYLVLIHYRGVGVRVPVGSRIFSPSSRPALGSTQPPIIEWVPGALSPGVERPGGEAVHSPPARAEVKKMWIYTSTPPYAFMAQCSTS
jgi:hypothetical protein